MRFLPDVFVLSAAPDRDWSRLKDSNPQAFMEPKRDPHHVLDDAVLAAGVHALQHYEQRPIGASVKAFLQLGELLDISSKHSVGGFPCRDRGRLLRQCSNILQPLRELR
jgi:hypothetical protein